MTMHKPQPAPLPAGDIGQQQTPVGGLYQDIVDHLDLGVILLDSDLTILATNPIYRAMFHLPPAVTEPGCNFRDLLKFSAHRGWLTADGDANSDDPEILVETRIKNFLRLPQTSCEEFILPNGTRVVCRRLQIGKNQIMATYQDVTEQEKLKAQLTHEKFVAEQANRSKGQFLANMSHELRTPLNAIIGFSEIIRDQLYGPIGTPQYSEFADDIRRSGEHLLTIINDILDMSKIDARQRKLSEGLLEVGAVLNSAIRMVRSTAMERNIDFQIIIPENLPGLIGEEKAFRQILLNLLSNAAKFTPDGGWICSSASLTPDGRLMIEVHDNGIGIPEDKIDHVVLPFVQIDNELSRRYQGTGLGLPLVKSLVELHGGELVLSSPPGRGTIAQVYFPSDRVVALDKNLDELKGILSKIDS